VSSIELYCSQMTDGGEVSVYSVGVRYRCCTHLVVVFYRSWTTLRCLLCVAGLLQLVLAVQLYVSKSHRLR